MAALLVGWCGEWQAADICGKQNEVTRKFQGEMV